MFVNVASENGESKLPSSRPYHSVKMNTGGNKLTEINTLMNATRRLIIAIEIKYLKEYQKENWHAMHVNEWIKTNYFER